MSHFVLFFRSGAALPILVTSSLLVCSCSSGFRGGERESLDGAIESFIAGDYEAAAASLEKLAASGPEDVDQVDVYLYLGRSYMALERYDRAVDAFRTGVAYGGGIVFEEYLRRLDMMLSGTPETVGMFDTVTRTQLAMLIERMFYLESDEVESQNNATVPRSVLDLTSVKRGIVPRLPDGDFHGDANVTRAAFYAAVTRLITDMDLDVDAAYIFDGGYRWVGAGPAGDPAATAFVTGKETVATLLRVSKARGGSADGG